MLLRTRSYLLNTAAMTAMTFAIGGVSYWVPKYVLEFRHYGTLDSVNSIFGAIVVVAGLTATLLGGWTGDALRPRFGGSYFLVSAAAMFLAFPLFLLVLVTPFPLAWVVIFAAVFCLFFNTGPSNTALANVTHPSIRATAFALNILIIHALGDVLSPPAIGAITDYFHGNMNMGFLAVSGAILVGAIIWFVAARYLGADTAAAPHRLATAASSPNDILA